jgi:hypothetical protein
MQANHAKKQSREREQLETAVCCLLARHPRKRLGSSGFKLAWSTASDGVTIIKEVHGASRGGRLVQTNLSN